MLKPGGDNYVFESMVPNYYETHGGEDVSIYASGPMSHMIRGVMEENVIAHVMAYAACVGEYEECSWKDEDKPVEPPVCAGTLSVFSYNILLLVTLGLTACFA